MVLLDFVACASQWITGWVYGKAFHEWEIVGHSLVGEHRPYGFEAGIFATVRRRTGIGASGLADASNAQIALPVALDQQVSASQPPVLAALPNSSAIAPASIAPASGASPSVTSPPGFWKALFKAYYDDWHPAPARPIRRSIAETRCPPRIRRFPSPCGPWAAPI